MPSRHVPVKKDFYEFMTKLAVKVILLDFLNLLEMRIFGILKIKNFKMMKLLARYLLIIKKADLTRH